MVQTRAGRDITDCRSFSPAALPGRKCCSAAPGCHLLLYTQKLVTSWEQYPENEVRIFNKGCAAAGRELCRKHNREVGLGTHKEKQEVQPTGFARSCPAGKGCVELCSLL